MRVTLVGGAICGYAGQEVGKAICEGGQKAFIHDPLHVHWYGNDIDPYGLQGNRAEVYSGSGGYVSHVADFEVVPPPCAPTYSNCRLADGTVLNNRFAITYYWPNGSVQRQLVTSSAKELIFVTQQTTYMSPNNYVMYVFVEMAYPAQLSSLGFFSIGGLQRILTVH